MLAEFWKPTTTNVFCGVASTAFGGEGHALVELVVTSVAVLRLIRLGEARVERRGFDLYVEARRDEG